MKKFLSIIFCIKLFMSMPSLHAIIHPADAHNEMNTCDCFSAFFTPTRTHELRRDLLGWQYFGPTKLNIGVYGPHYPRDFSKILIDFDPEQLPASIKEFLRDHYDFQLPRDAANIEFDAMTWQLQQASVDAPIDAPRNLILHGLLARWSERPRFRRDDLSDLFNVNVTAGIFGLNGITVTDFHNEPGQISMPAMLTPGNLNVSFHTGEHPRYISPDNGRFMLEARREIGTFWLVAIYDPATDPDPAKHHLPRKVLVSFNIIMRSNEAKRGLTERDFNTFNRDLLDGRRTLLEVTTSEHGFSLFTRALDDDANRTALFNALWILRDPSHVVVDIPAAFFPAAVPIRGGTASARVLAGSPGVATALTVPHTLRASASRPVARRKPVAKKVSVQDLQKKLRFLNGKWVKITKQIFARARVVGDLNKKLKRKGAHTPQIKKQLTLQRAALTKQRRVLNELAKQQKAVLNRLISMLNAQIMSTQKARKSAQQKKKLTVLKNQLKAVRVKQKKLEAERKKAQALSKR